MSDQAVPVARAAPRHRRAGAPALFALILVLGLLGMHGLTNGQHVAHAGAVIAAAPTSPVIAPAPSCDAECATDMATLCLALLTATVMCMRSRSVLVGRVPAAPDPRRTGVPHRRVTRPPPNPVTVLCISRT